MRMFGFGARDRYLMVDKRVDKAKSVFTKTIHKLSKANEELDNMDEELTVDIEESISVRDSVRMKKQSNMKMIEKINGLIE